MVNAQALMALVCERLQAALKASTTSGQAGGVLTTGEHRNRKRARPEARVRELGEVLTLDAAYMQVAPAGQRQK
jgi:hypothetical protein